MNNKPVQTFRAGTVSASVFRNERTVKGSKVDIPSVTIQKRYESDGQWKSTSSLDVNDIPKAILVLLKAFDSVASRSSEQVDTDSELEPTPDE